jgi:CubicO group peptidase (beta-lactamase class C family)
MPLRPASRILRESPAALAATLIAGALTCAGAEAPPFAGDSDLAERIDAYVAPLVEAGHLSGTLLVARKGNVVFEESWGLADAEHSVPNQPDTRIGIASVTKPMTIALVCRLAEEGKLMPDDTLARWIDDFPRGDEITVSHLLNHRACIPHRVTTPEQETVPRTAADMVELAKEKGLLPHEPGEKSIYSSAGFSVLARIVELASGMTYNEALQHYLCEPAGMERTGHYDSRELVKDRARGYFRGAGGMVNTPLQDLSFLVGAGSVISTPQDLHRMIRAVVDGRLGEVVSPALMREHGMSWNGVTNGFRAFAEYDKDDDTEIIFTGNLLTGAADHLQRDISRIVTGESVDPPQPPRPALADVDPEIYRSAEGRYTNDAGKEFPARVSDGQLWFGQWPLLAVSSTELFCMQDYARVELKIDADGTVTGLDWIRPDGTYGWTRDPGE